MVTSNKKHKLIGAFLIACSILDKNVKGGKQKLQSIVGKDLFHQSEDGKKWFYNTNAIGKMGNNELSALIEKIKEHQKFIYVAYAEDDTLSVGIRSKHEFTDAIRDDGDDMDDYYLYISFRANCEKYESKEMALSVEWIADKKAWIVTGQNGFTRTVEQGK